MRGAPAGHERLKAALAQHAPSVIQLFKHADLNGDGRINRSEFVEMVLTYAPLHEHPPEEGILPFSAEDAEALFALLDRDRGGTIDYRELERELKRDLRGELEDAKLRERASSLLRRTDVVVVLGAATKTKQALCRKLAYVFDGVWVSKASLVERELHAYGSKLAPEIRRRTSAEPPKPLSTSFYRQMLHAAVHGPAPLASVGSLPGSSTRDCASATASCSVSSSVSTAWSLCWWGNWGGMQLCHSASCIASSAFRELSTHPAPPSKSTLGVS
jgi:hypothetical protein